MRIRYSNTLIASPDLADRCIGPSGLSWAGQPILDVANFFRADYATVYGRGDGVEEFSFAVWRIFASEAEAIAFASMHRSGLPIQADLVLVDDEESVALVMADAVRAVQVTAVVGVSVRVEYRFTGSHFTSEDIPDPPEEGDTMKTGLEELSEGDESKAVVFSSAFTTRPRGVCATICAPTGGYVISCAVDEDLIDENGFTVRFGAAIPAAGYKLSWIAIL